MARKRLYPVAVVRGKVLAGDEAALARKEGGDLLGDGATIEDVWARLGDGGERATESLCARDAANGGNFAIGQIILQERTMRVRPGPHEGERAMERWPDGEAFLGVADGGSEYAREAEPPKALLRHAPAVGAAWHGHRMDAKVGHFTIAERVVALDGRRRWRAPAGVQSVEALRTRVVEQYEKIATQTDDERPHDLEHGVRRDGRIQRGATFLEHLESRLRRQVVRRRHHAMTGHGDWPMLRKMRERLHPRGPFRSRPPVTQRERVGIMLIVPRDGIAFHRIVNGSQTRATKSSVRSEMSRIRQIPPGLARSG